ncbi:uncharacterized protein LOC116262311 isoform X1 [Nymphaea colorata]|nr:uncharacterized protein LOC116262311 isoform X1 [Nymphaea colorata]XP_031497414.1 uncharacterized protein LOC116262311 isoform X1 [Nymphaea colorata]
MPRKVSYGVDYDDDYDYYDDYDYDYDFEDAKGSSTSESLPKPGTWCCPICTYDNEEKLTYCDICGVIRYPPVKSLSEKNEEAVDLCNGRGASKLAKSLFPALPAQKLKTGVTFQPVYSLSKDVDGSHGIEKIKWKFSDFEDSFLNHDARYRFNIAPFKFDKPSPDDVVSAAKRSGNSLKGTSHAALSKASLGTNMDQGTVDLLPNASKHGASSSRSSVEVVQFKAEDKRVDSKSYTSNGSSLLEDGQPQSLVSGVSKLKLNEAADSTKTVRDMRKAVPLDAYKPETWVLPDKKCGGLSQLNLAIVGHVDSGKSTLTGRLLHILGRISQKDMHKYEKEAKQQGKGSFAYAWALDESVEERERGITMAVAVARFESRKFHVVMLDSPGHKDFVSNMISGATQADAAILVVDASIGSFEAGMGLNGVGGQTKEHAQLIRSFGVEQLVVAVNKMDSVGYSKERFDSINMQLGGFLRSCGFKESHVSWVPLSVMENQNLVAAITEPRFSWYKGFHLLDAIDSLLPPEREIFKPLRLPICDVIKSRSLGQAAVSGKVEAGAIRNGTKVLVMPSGDVATVRCIEQDSHACGIARAGDNVDVGLQGVDGASLITGGVLCHPEFPIAVASHLELKVLVLDIKMPIIVGFQVEFHIHHAKEAAKVERIISLLDPKTGKVSKKAPRCLTSKQSAIIEVILGKELCVEEFSNYRALGRAYLRASGQTVAVGIVTRLVH